MMAVETTSRSDLKRDRDSFEELEDLEEPCSVPADFLEQETKHPEMVSEPSHEVGATPSTSSTNPVPPSSPTSTNPTNPVPSSNTPATMNNAPTPPAKKPKLTFQEKEMKKINKEIKDREKAEEKARKEAEKLAQAEEKARKEVEKEAERKRKEVEKAEKEAEKKRKEAEREDKRRRVEEDKKKKEEKKQNANKNQMKLGNFFRMPQASRQRTGSVDSTGRTSMSPAPPSLNPSLAAVGTPSKSKSEYETLFPPFFLQSGVTLAPSNRFERDEPSTQYVERQLDNHISGAEKLVESGSFDAVSLFNMSSYDSAPRGKRCMPVREIMEEFYSGKASRPMDLTTESQNSQIKRTRDHLQKVPLKFLKFQEDVRPPYRGTYTSRPVNGIAKLARKPFRRDLPKTDYDYDSEAEWIEDEDGEDLQSGDEEDEVEDEEDMDGFLDDEGDEIAQSKRLVFQGDLEPESSGLCWEDKRKKSTNVKMLRYRMEVILDSTIKSINPFSTSYWEPTITGMEPPRIPLNSMKATSLNFNGAVHSSPGTKPVKPFFPTASDPSSKPSPLGQSSTSAKHSITKDGKPIKMLPAEDMEAFKTSVEGSNLSKVGLIEVLKKQFAAPAPVIKLTLETYAQRGRKGEKAADKKWFLIDSNEM